MKTENRNFMRQLVQQFDLMNTINGGVSQTSVDVSDLENRTELKIYAPGVRPETFNIYINNNQLMVFSILNERETADSVLTIPLFSKTWTLPAYVDFENIEALHEDGKLKIILPYKNDSKINFRKINIKSTF